jgi:hypothetical protein
MKTTPEPHAGPATAKPGSSTQRDDIAARSHAAPASGHPWLTAGPAIAKPGSSKQRDDITMRSHAASVSGHPRPKPSSRHPLQ